MRLQAVLSIGLRIVMALFFIAAFSGLRANLSAQSFRGGIRGEITDAHGLHVPGAKVIARNLATSDTREVTGDAEGEYFFLELPAGQYEVSAVAPGLQEYRQGGVTVSAGEETIVNLQLAKPTEAIERVEVIEAAPIVETTNNTLSQVVDRKLVQELPLNGRDFGKLVALTPGVTVEGSGVAGSEKGFGQFNINGNRDRSNNYMLDGTDNNDPFFNNSALNQVGISGAPATLLPLDAIQEFNLQSQFGAEYGRNSGSAVNIVTRSGGNAFHGSLFEYNRNSYFDARNYFNPSPDPQSHFNNNNFGGSLGGPIVREKTFFFLAYEGQREVVGSDFTFLVPRTGTSVNDIQAAEQDALAQTYMPLTNGINPALLKILNYFPANPTSSNSISGTDMDTNNGDNFIVKLDQKLGSNSTLTGRYAFGQSNQVYPLGSLGGYGSGSRLSSFEQASPTRVQVLSASLLTTFSPTRLNELRFGYSRFRTSFSSVDQLDPTTLGNGFDFGNGKVGLPEIDFNGDLENLGTSGYSVPRGRVSETFQTLDNYTLVNGRQTLKFGGEYHRYDVQSFNDNLERGILQVYTTIDDGTGNYVALDPNPVVNELANFFIGNISGLALTGNTSRFTFNNNISFFAQDEIRVRPNLTLNLGLRWEYFGPLGERHNELSNFDASGNLVQLGTPTLPLLYHRDLNNFGPRVGLVWSPRRNTTVRAAYGMYYDYIPQDILIANYTNSAGVATNPSSATNGSISVPVNGLDFNGNVWNGSATGTIYTPTAYSQSIFVTEQNFRTPYVQSWNLNIQRQFNEAVAFEIGYVGTKGTRLTRLYDANQDGNNADYYQIAVLATTANSTYNALQTTLRLNNWHHFSGFSTYTLSKSLDGASDGIDFNGATAAFPQNSDDLPAEKGPSTFDTRHRWTSVLNYQLPAFAALPKLLADGWQMNTIVTVQSGRPIGVYTGGGLDYHQRPDIVPGVNPILPNWTPATGYLNPAAFQQPAGNFGDLGRNQIYGPGFWNADFSISKTTKLKETLSLQFRAELFNIFNHPNFALPTNVITPGIQSDGTPLPLLPGCSSLAQCYPAGRITQTPDVAQGNPGLGGGGPRVLQFGLRLQF